MKNFNTSSRYQLQFRGEFFNAFNHTNFNTVDVGLNDAAYGRLTTAHEPRQVQLAVKLYF